MIIILEPWRYKIELNDLDLKLKYTNYIDGLAEWLKQWNPPGL